VSGPFNLKVFVFSLYCQAEAETEVNWLAIVFWNLSKCGHYIWLYIAIYIVAFGRPRFCQILVQLGR